MTMKAGLVLVSRSSIDRDTLMLGVMDWAA
jgi:hypothetical protein